MLILFFQILVIGEYKIVDLDSYDGLEILLQLNFLLILLCNGFDSFDSNLEFESVLFRSLQTVRIVFLNRINFEITLLLVALFLRQMDELTVWVHYDLSADHLGQIRARVQFLFQVRLCRPRQMTRDRMFGI